jgi:hypothetical protein
MVKEKKIDLWSWSLNMVDAKHRFKADKTHFNALLREQQDLFLKKRGNL